MESNLLVLCLFLYLLGFFALRSHAGEGDVLFDFFKAKLEWNLAADGSTSGHFHSTNRHLIGLEQNIHPVKRDAPVYSQIGLKEKDKIVRLPGQPHKVNFNQYGGYVTVNKNPERALYYYFVEAKGPKDTLPLLLWLNGGPGCSSLGVGAMSEIGPFRVSSDGITLVNNRFAWNGVANLLFLESPAGVGYSYSTTTSDYESSGDQKTAHDSYVFLLNWFERFPEYKNREFYIAGESYAGHFVPQLAHTILSTKRSPFINLKGIAMGNPVLTSIEESSSSAPQYEYFWSHALISDNMMNTIHKACDFSVHVSERSKECLQNMLASLHVLSHIDKYNIYASVCRSARTTTEPKPINIESFDPCNEHYVKTYLNRPEVQEAIHANVTKLHYQWNSCSDIINSTMWTDAADTTLPILRECMANGIRILVYSGDLDAIVPIACTRDALNKFQITEKTAWYAWNVSGQVGGYSMDYKEGLTFASVRGAGHEVPSYQPRRALTLIKSFLDGVPLSRFADD